MVGCFGRIRKRRIGSGLSQAKVLQRQLDWRSVSVNCAYFVLMERGCQLMDWIDFVKEVPTLAKCNSFNARIHNGY